MLASQARTGDASLECCVVCCCAVFARCKLELRLHLISMKSNDRLIVCAKTTNVVRAERALSTSNVL